MSRYFAEIAVVGGGIIGASIAYHLARDGADVVLLERGDLGSGTSSRCDGCLIIQSKGAGLKLDLALESACMYRRLADELGEDIELETCGCAVALESEGQLRAMEHVAGELEGRGLEIEIWPQEELCRRMPGIQGAPAGACYHAGDGQVNPLKATFAFGAAAKRLGARIMTFCEVKGLSIECGKLKKIATASGDLFSSKLVNAAGVWAPSVARMAGVAAPVVPKRGQRFVTEASEQFLPFILMSGSYLGAKLGLGIKEGAGERFERLGVGLIAHHTRSGNTIVGSTSEPGLQSVATSPEGLFEMAKNAFDLLPGLGRSTIIRTFAGLRPFSPDGLPMIGPDERLPWFITAAGHGGDGISLAPVTGKIVADIVKTGSAPTRLKELAPSRFAAAAG